MRQAGGQQTEAGRQADGRELEKMREMVGVGRQRESTGARGFGVILCDATIFYTL
jgi:hypothetical protein